MSGTNNGSVATIDGFSAVSAEELEGVEGGDVKMPTFPGCCDLPIVKLVLKILGRS